jgi:hypothetical protein
MQFFAKAVSACTISQGLGQMRLAGAGWAVQDLMFSAFNQAGSSVTGAVE